MTGKRNGLRFVMFVIGLFSVTQVQVVGSIGISELVMYLVAPFVYLSNLRLFRSDKCNTFVFLVFLSLVGCVLCSWVNHIDMPRFLRGFATPYGFFASFVVFYPILRKDPMSFAWYLLGACFSVSISTFVFQGAYEVLDAETRGGGVEAITEGAIFWISRIGPYVTWPVSAFYLKTPILYSIAAPAAFGSYALFTTASGRSTALMSLAGAVLIVYARKNQERMKDIRKHIVLFAIGAIVFVAVFKAGYSYAAKTGMLGEVARLKYESQTRGGTDSLHLLMAGRGEMFLGAYYVSQRPILGYGPWALDDDGLYLDFYARYGLVDDYEQLVQSMCCSGMKVPLVGAHSAMLQFWLAYGILGLPVWIYLFYLLYDYFTRRIGSVPEFYGYFALTLPGTVWSVFFSPFGQRVGWGFLLAMLLVNRAMSRELKIQGVRYD